MFFTDIPSPVGPLRLASDGTSVTGLWLENQKYFSTGLDPAAQKAPALPIFREAALWLDDYFAGNRPSALPPLSPAGSAFQQSVWNRLLDIPCGQTRTYGALAADLGSSPRAVGSAVSRNPISILIPCHRVLGTDGSLTGYAGGLEKKRFLLMLEGVDTTRPNTRERGKRPKFQYLPEARNNLSLSPEEPPPPPEPGKFPCPCCGYKTLPVPKADAAACICPVCFWENDVFDPGEDQPSDENRGMTLRHGREAFRRLGAVREEFLPYVREPLPEEIP
ncbi:methylated-DNA--[protein]-cysteine S-methyltransferase [Oscillospiraceae bacterium 50-60]